MPLRLPAQTDSTENHCSTLTRHLSCCGPTRCVTIAFCCVLQTRSLVEKMQATNYDVRPTLLGFPEGLPLGPQVLQALLGSLFCFLPKLHQHVLHVCFSAQVMS